MKKIFVLCYAFAVLFVCSCGRTVRDMSCEELSSLLVKASGKELVCTDIKIGDGYMIGIDDAIFDKYIKNAKRYSETIGADGYELTVILTGDEKDASDLRAEIEEHHEWAPCDPAEKVIFANLGKAVISVKGKADDADIAYRAFCSSLGRKECFSTEKTNKQR